MGQTSNMVDVIFDTLAPVISYVKASNGMPL
jgi:hypothetical protein